MPGVRAILVSEKSTLRYGLILLHYDFLNAVLSGSGLAQSYIKYECDYEGCCTLSLRGFVPNCIDDFGPRYKVEKSIFIFDPRTGTNSNNVICVGLSSIPRHGSLSSKSTSRFDGHKGAIGPLICSRSSRYPRSKCTGRYTYRF